MKEEQKKPTPPYLSMSKLAKLVEVITSRNMSQINPSYFIGQGFSQADAYVAINSLRFLGLIDNASNTTASFRKFQLVGAQGKKEVVEIIKSSYSKLFESFVVGNPYDAASEENLINDFMIQYEISKRIAVPATKAFLWLCEFAGLREITIKTQERKKRNPINKKTGQTKQDVPAQNKEGNFPTQQTTAQTIPANSAGTHVFNDSGFGWKLQIISGAPLTAEIKRLLVDISEKLDILNTPT